MRIGDPLSLDVEQCRVSTPLFGGKHQMEESRLILTGEVGFGRELALRTRAPVEPTPKKQLTQEARIRATPIFMEEIFAQM